MSSFPSHFHSVRLKRVCLIAFISVFIICGMFQFHVFHTHGPSHSVSLKNAFQSQLKRTMRNLNITDFKLLHSPPLCKGQLVAILVLSAPSHFNRRKIIRQTWARNYHVHFLIGQTRNETLQQQIDAEAFVYQDLLQGTFLDTYRNLTHKTLMGLSWAHDHCMTEFVLKADDDMLLNVLNIERYLQKMLCQAKLNNLDPEKPKTDNSPKIYCDLVYGSRVYRIEGFKWSLTFEEYANETFPTYCQGANGILYSKESIPILLEQMGNVGFVWLEDVYVSGILRNVAQLEAKQIDEKYITEYVEEFNESNGIIQSMFGPVGLEEEEMVSLWERAEEARADNKRNRNEESIQDISSTS